jgi:hypothetical protein
MKVKINRAPVLTLWAVVVAEHLGYSRETALTLGKAVAGLNAQSKGRRLGLFEGPQADEKKREAKAQPVQELVTVPMLGRLVIATKTEQGVRALDKGQPIDPQSVQRYLEQKFGENLTEAQAAMAALAGSLRSEKLATQAFALYEKFRPSIPAGKQGWGAAGELDLDLIHSLAEKKKPL